MILHIKLDTSKLPNKLKQAALELYAFSNSQKVERLKKYQREYQKEYRRISIN